MISITLAIGGAGGGARTDADVAGYTKARLLSGASVSAGGAVTISSDATARAHAKSEGGSGGVLAITVMLAEATTTSTTLATIESGAAITSSASVTVASTRGATSGNTQTTLSEIVLGSVALLAGAGGTSDTTDSGEVTGSVADGASVTSSGPIAVTATATTNTKSSGNGGTGAAVGVTVILITATASNAVNAVIGDASVNGGGKVDVIAKASTTVDVQLLTVTVAIVGGAGGSATAKSTGDTTARVGVAQGTNAPTTPRHLDVTGDITVLAGATHRVTSDTDGGAGGGVGIAGIVSTAKIEGDTRAYTGPGAWVKGNSLTLRTTDATGGATTNTVRDVEANSIMGAVAVLAGTGSTSTATVIGSVEAFVGPAATIAVTGALTIDANSDTDAFADARGGAGGGIAISAFFADASIGSTSAFLGKLRFNGTTVTRVGSGSFLDDGLAAGQTIRFRGSTSTGSSSDPLDAIRRIVSVTATTITLDTSITGGTGLPAANAEIDKVAVYVVSAVNPADDPSGTRAYVGEGADVTAGSISLTADGSDEAKADLLAVGVGLAAGAGGRATATVDSDVEAFVGRRTGTAILDTTVTATAGTVGALAQSSQLADAELDGGGGGAIGIAWLVGKTELTSTTSAFLGDRVKIDKASGVTLEATALGATSTADVLVGSGGVISIGGSEATATASPTVNAAIGDGVVIGDVSGATPVPILGSVTVKASGRAEADAVANAYGGGGIQIGIPAATANVAPTVNASIGTAGATSPTVIRARGTVELQAQLLQTGTTPTDAIQGVSAENDTITFTFPGINEGDLVRYQTTDQRIVGLWDDHEYTVIETDTVGAIRLGSLFDAGGLAIDPLEETITFVAPHGFESGDCVVYDTRGGISILRTGVDVADASDACHVADKTTFYVRVIDSNTIKLATTRAAATTTTPAPITITPASATLLTLSSTTGISAGTPVVYVAPVDAEFSSAFVNVTLVNVTNPTPPPATVWVPNTNTSCPGASCGQTIHAQDQENIYVGTSAYNNLATGQAVRYTLLEGPAITNLTSGGIYYVIRVTDGTNTLIRLAATYCEAVGGSGPDSDPSCTFNPTPDPPGPDPDPNPDDNNTPIARNPINLTTNGDAATHRLERALGDLVSGRTYYVRAAPNSDGQVELLSIPTGTTPVNVDGTGRGGGHAIGIVQVDLQVGSGTQVIYANLTSSSLPSGSHTLAGPSGASLASIKPPSGNGKSEVTVNGGSGGGINVSVPSSKINGAPQVTALLAAGTVDAGVSVKIGASAKSTAEAYANAAGGGVIEVGEAHADTVFDTANTKASVANNSEVTAGQDVRVSAVSDHTISATALSKGGGIISGKIAETTARIDNDTTAAIGAGAKILAGNHVVIESTSSTSGTTSADTYSVGVGSGADSDNTNDDRGVAIGTGDDASRTEASIGQGARVEGGTVDLHASVAKLVGKATAKAVSINPILLGVATAHANADVDVNSDVVAHIAGNGPTPTIVRGTRGVDIQARTAEATITRDAQRLAVAIIPPQAAHAGGTDDFDVEVDTDKNVLVIAGARRDEADSGLAVLPSPGNVALYGQADNVTLSVDNAPALDSDRYRDSNQSSSPRNGDIDWDADVVILGGLEGAPLLVVDADGKVVAVNAVKVNGVVPAVGADVDPDANGEYTIGPILNSGYANVLLFADNEVEPEDFASNTDGEPNQTWPVFQFNDTLDSVTLVDYSGKRVVIQDIDVVNDLLGGEPLVVIQAISGASTDTLLDPDGPHAFRSHATLEFDVRHAAAPAYVDIEKRGAANITLAGVVNNPTGLTRIVSTAGSIGSTTGRVVTNLLDVAALAPNESIGDESLTGDAAGLRFVVDLVQFLERPRLGGPTTPVVRAPRIVATAGLNAYLSLRGIDRTGSMTGVTAVTSSGSPGSLSYAVARTTGSWTATGQGFATGDTVAAFGATGSALGTFTVTSVDATTLALTPIDSSTLPSGSAVRSFVRLAEMTIGIDLLEAGQDVNVELRTTVRQPGTSGTADVRVEVTGESGIGGVSWWPTARVHRFHFRGITASNPDPARDGATAERDPAIYPLRVPPPAGLPVSVEVDGAYRFQLMNAILDRNEVALPGLSLVHYAAATRSGSFVLFAEGPLPATENRAGIAAGRHIAIRDTEGIANGDSAADSGAAPRIRVLGYTDLGALGGWLDVNVDGSVDLEEVAGDMRVGLVRSRTSDVKLTADVSILDANTGETKTSDVDPRDVEGVNIDLFALEGSIGTEADFVETNLLDTAHPGTLDAAAALGAYLYETAGNLRVGLVDADQDDATKVTDVVLVARDGSIQDGDNDVAADVEAIRIDLYAPLGGIGTVNNDFDINSSNTGPQTGRLYALADDSVYITETDDELVVLAAKSLTGDVRLTMPDTDDPRGPPGSEAQPEDLILVATGTSLVSEGVRLSTTPTGDPVSGIWAKLDIILLVGDDVYAPVDTLIIAGGTITIRGDHGNADAGAAPAGWGTTMYFAGRVGGVFDLEGADDPTLATLIFGHTDVDDFAFDATYLGADTTVYGSQDLSAAEPDGEDRFLVDELQTMDVAAGHTLTLDGQAKSDTYTVQTTGSEGTARNYVINVLDTGAPDDGVDELAILGTASSDDIFLLRRSTSIGRPADRPAFVALLHGDLGLLRDAIQNNETSASVQRINYDAALNGRLSVYGLGGDDFFATDDNSAITTLDGGAGNDIFQIGQVFGTKRDVANGGVAAGDVFPELIATTRGYLSPGISAPLVADGGAGNDQFTVYSNQAELRLEGDDGNDFFIVRAFALALTDADGDLVLDGNGLPVPAVGFSTARPLDIRTGGGDDEVQYNINAPVSIDGGAGFDKVVVLGTEFPDDIVITADAIFGAGVNVRYATVESVEVDGLEGDDEFFVLSTAFGVSSRVIGGLGSDTINVGGDVVEDIVVRELEGASGTVDHLVTSAGDIGYDGLPVPGIDVQVGGVNEGLVVITESDGFTAVQEGGPVSIDSYTVRLSRAPTSTVYVTVSAARPARDEALGTPAGESVWLCTGPSAATCDADGEFQRHIVVNGANVDVQQYALVLVFTPADYATAQTVYVLARDDLRPEGDRVVAISHSALSADPLFNGAAVRNVEASVRDNDTPNVVVVQVTPGTSTGDARSVVLEGDGGAGFGDELLVSLAMAPAPGTQVVVRLTAGDSQVTLSHSTITFGALDWFIPVRVTVTAAPDFRREDPHTTGITIARDSATTDAGYAFADQRIGVRVLDDDTPGVIVTESGTSTVVTAGGPGDDYTIRLTQKPTANVQVAILTDGLTDVATINGSPVTMLAIATFTGALSFDAANRRITRTDGGSFLAAGFLEGQRISVDGAGTYKIAIIRGFNATQDDTLELTDEFAAPALPTGTHTIARLAAAVTFTPADYATPRTIGLVADTHFEIPLVRQGSKTFGGRPHLLGELQGALAVEGGVSDVDRSLQPALKLPGEKDGPLFGIAGQGDEAEQVDVLNVFNDSSRQDWSGTLTSGSLSGFGMVEPLTFGSSPSTIEVLNILLGSGNDRLRIEGTLIQATPVAVHGSITAVHGGGNSPLQVSGQITLAGITLTRGDGLSWTDDGFAAGQVVSISGIGERAIVAVSGAVLTLATPVGSGTALLSVAVVDPQTPGTPRIGGDRITVVGGGGPDSPLVIYGDTSQDGIWYSGNPSDVEGADFGPKPFDVFPGVPDEDERFVFPLADPFDFAGHDVIDASANAAHITAYGGAGDDTIVGSQAGDFLAGGSGDDLIDRPGRRRPDLRRLRRQRRRDPPRADDPDRERERRAATPTASSRAPTRCSATTATTSSSATTAASTRTC